MKETVIDIYWEEGKLKYIDKDFTKNYSWSTKTTYLNGKRIKMIAFGKTHDQVYNIHQYEFENSLLVKEETTFPNGDRESSYINYIYDSNGNNLRKTEFNKSNDIQYDYRYAYNQKNQLVRQDAFNYLGDPTMKIEYTYDQNENLIEEFNKDFFDDDSITTYAYDIDGNQIDKKYYSPIDNLRNNWIAKYDNAGNQILSEFWIRGMKCLSRTEFSHNKMEGIEKRVIMNPEDNSQKIQTIEIKENKYGDWTEKRIYENEVLKSMHKRIIEYAV